MISSSLMANDHQIYISSLDFSLIHRLINSYLPGWLLGISSLTYPKQNSEFCIPMLLENGNDNTNQSSSELSGFILDLCLYFTTYVRFANKSYFIISKTHPHLTTACHLHFCSLVQVLSSVAWITTKAF